jgi:hypothetical protein
VCVCVFINYLFIVYADEWTHRAQRGERFEDTLLSLRDLLLRWRREQVRTFDRTLVHIDKNIHVDTVLAAKTIVHSVFELVKLLNLVCLYYFYFTYTF